MTKKRPKEITSLELLPRASVKHSWVDYIELLCLFNVDREISKDVIIDRFREGLDTGASLYDDTDDDTETDSDSESTGYAPADEKLDKQVEDLFRHLKYREGAFGRRYPFSVDMTYRRMTLARTSGLNRLYLFLLIAANLRYFKALTPQITSDFEELSSIALEELLPQSADVHLFHGAGRSGRYKGKLFQKLSTLANDLFETMIVKVDDFDENDMGDGGLDIVAWVPMADQVPGVVLCFVQCACTDKWVKKQRETMAVHEVMTIKADPVRITCIPFCFRRPTGGWFYNHSVETVLLDRLRLVHLINKPRRFSSFSSFKTIAALINSIEPIV